MPIEVILPRVDMDMVSGRISRWFVAEGDTVRKGQVLFEIETDKSAMEVDSPATGVIRDLSMTSSADISVGSSVARIFQESEAYTVKTELSSVSDLKVENIFEKNSFSNYDQFESISEVAGISVSQKIISRATPLARRLAKEKSINLSLVQGTGLKGRVQSEDVLKYKTDFIADSKINLANNNVPSDDSVKKLFSPGSFIEVPHDTMRKTIARRLLESKQTVPHFYVSADCELDRLL
ncbi:MAG: biotin/lipoyl-containing protein, partial [Hyphomicrobiales bacterium]